MIDAFTLEFRGSSLCRFREIPEKVGQLEHCCALVSLTVAIRRSRYRVDRFRLLYICSSTNVELPADECNEILLCLKIKLQRKASLHRIVHRLVPMYSPICTQISDSACKTRSRVPLDGVSRRSHLLFLVTRELY